MAFWPLEPYLVEDCPALGTSLAVLDPGAKDRVQHRRDRHRKHVDQVPETRPCAEPGILLAHLLDDLSLVKRAHRVVHGVQGLVARHGRDQGLQVIIDPRGALPPVFPNVGAFIGTHLTLRSHGPGLTGGLPDKLSSRRK